MPYGQSVQTELLNSPNPGCNCEGICDDPGVCACLIRSLGCNYDPTDNSLLQLKPRQPVIFRPVYECNSRCSCRKETCCNRVVQSRCHDPSALIPIDAGDKGR
uniref:Pre-SET domain-containing protein n=1 Tax=Mesocestoides corti TaxID=53468 RepID=A0A5K3FXX8_MESCO